MNFWRSTEKGLQRKASEEELIWDEVVRSLRVLLPQLSCYVEQLLNQWQKPTRTAAELATLPLWRKDRKELVKLVDEMQQLTHDIHLQDALFWDKDNVLAETLRTKIVLLTLLAARPRQLG